VTCLTLAFFGARAAAEPYLGGAVQTGACELSVDPGDEGAALGFAACLRGETGAEITAVAGAPRENSWLRYAQGDLGLFYGQYLSVQGRGHVRDFLPIEHGKGPKRVANNLERQTDFAVVQVGNPALTRFWLEAGRLSLPFGLDKSWATQSYQRFASRAFWSSPEYGAALSIDNKVNTRLDIGYAEDPRSMSGRDFPAAADLRRIGSLTAASARLSYDMSALDGTRLILSGYGENHGVRKMGFGFVNVSRKGDSTEFEFARRMEEPIGGIVPYEQLLRLAYAGAYRGGSRTVVQFDDERFRFRMGTVGQDYLFGGQCSGRLALTYQKSETGDRMRRWMLTTGLEAKL
jgi:hypothetical protein